MVSRSTAFPPVLIKATIVSFQPHKADRHAFLGNIRQDLPPKLPAGDFGNLKVGVGEVFSAAAISPTRQAVGESGGGASFVSASDLNLFDGLHFDAAGQLSMVARMADTLMICEMEWSMAAKR